VAEADNYIGSSDGYSSPLSPTWWHYPRQRKDNKDAGVGVGVIGEIGG